MLATAPLQRLPARRATRSASVQTWRSRDGSVITLRPARSEDVALAREFLFALSPHSRYQRFLSARRLQRAELEQFVRTDAGRALALIASVHERGAEKQIGAAHCIAPGGAAWAEFALVVADDWQRRGLGERLLVASVEHARELGARGVFGITAASNTAMCGLARKCGAQLRVDAEDAALVQVCFSVDHY
jgi:acetyltransferase